ncbi:unnamed protein product [Effrenium voratum]|nr:unnamed protein product [Effrenium voratum]
MGDSHACLLRLEHFGWQAFLILRAKSQLLTWMAELKLSRDDKPERKWQGTSYAWNRKIPLWTGSAEAEGLSELFVDNLGSLLGTTGACVGHIGYGIVGTMGAFTAVAMTDGSTYATAVA